MTGDAARSLSTSYAEFNRFELNLLLSGGGCGRDPLTPFPKLASEKSEAIRDGGSGRLRFKLTKGFGNCPTGGGSGGGKV